MTNEGRGAGLSPTIQRWKPALVSFSGFETSSVSMISRSLREGSGVIMETWECGFWIRGNISMIPSDSGGPALTECVFCSNPSRL